MRRHLLLLVLLLLTGCQGQLPPDKTHFVGLWKNNTMSFLITKEGSVKYERITNMTKSVSGPIKSFTNETITVGLWFITTDFTINQPPTQDKNGLWYMIIDGEKLFRTNDFGAVAPESLPTTEALHALTNQQISLINVGIKTKDFSAFLAQAASAFREQFSSEKITQILASFITQSLFLDPYLQQDNFSITDGPSLDANGILRYAGHYQASNEMFKAQLDFKFGFIYEETDWMLVSFEIDSNTNKK